jgi:hypothetical protein
MVYPQVVDDGDGLQIIGEGGTSNVLNKEQRTNDNGRSSIWCLCEGLMTSHSMKPAFYEMLPRALDLLYVGRPKQWKI